MKLSYRGVSYEYNPGNTTDVETVRPAVDLKYRGASYRCGENAKAERLGAIFKYRGASYSDATVAPVEAVSAVAEPVAVVASSIEDRARLLNLSHARNIKKRHQVALARTATEGGFSNELVNSWSQLQNEIDSAFGADYDRSYATLS